MYLNGESVSKKIAYQREDFSRRGRILFQCETVFAEGARDYRRSFSDDRVGERLPAVMGESCPRVEQARRILSRSGGPI
jgi:hypothetical protein